ncbi:MAG: ribulose-phosphate 3-epimerase [Thermoflexaceae bacterium]|nr:ribulose-phosphate 3-epimerase [Thermoflexaceae bacterium]
MNILSPSILSADFSVLGEEIKAVDEAGVQYIHVDVMDGMFVPSISYGMPVIKSIRKTTQKIFDVHLMIEEPIRYIKEFVEAGADMITVHVEACSDVAKTLEEIKKYGVKCGITLNPETEVSAIEPYIPMVDMVLVMSVHPGFGGQKFIESSLDKVRTVKKMIDDAGLCTDIEIDGGINLDNLSDALKAGANVIVAGSAIFKNDAGANVKKFLDIMEGIQ